MRTILILVGVVCIAGGLAGCGDDRQGDDGRTKVVAAFFPLAEAARQVGGDSVDVVDLTPPGVEPHDLEVTTRIIDQIQDADLVIVMGDGFQPAIENATRSRRGATVRIFDALGIDGHDPHVWLDPTIYSRMVGTVGDALHADPARVRAYQEAIAELDRRFAARLRGCRERVLVASHAAYGYLAARYGLRQESITGLVPDEEPDPAKLDELATLVAREHVTTIFNEPLLPRRAAATLAREAHAEVATLDPLESDPGTSYIDAMDANLTNLANGLACP